MKTLLSVIFALAIMAGHAIAQGYTQYTPVLVSNLLFAAATETNGIGAFKTNTLTSVGTGTQTIDVRRQDTLAIDLWIKPALSNAVNLKFQFAPSLDNVNFNYKDPITVYPAAKTTNIVIGGTYAAGVWVNFRTNLNVAGLGYLKLYEVANVDYTASATNIWFTYAIKR